MSIVFNNISDEVDETPSVKKGKTTMWKELYYYIEMKKERKKERSENLRPRGYIRGWIHSNNRRINWNIATYETGIIFGTETPSRLYFNTLPPLLRLSLLRAKKDG